MEQAERMTKAERIRKYGEVFTPGWMDSKGATIEDLLAIYNGKPGTVFIGESQIRRVFCEAKP